MEIATFDSERFLNRGELFSKEIHENHWILFHGTSSIFEESILEHGLSWVENEQYSISTITSIVNQYEKMSWAGDDTGGFAVLKPFSLDGDFRKSDNKPIFLADEASRAFTFATKGFAGGETARAIRKSLSDLKKYCTTSELRSKHLKQLWKKLLPDSSWFEVLPEQLRGINVNNVTPEIYSKAWTAMNSNYPILTKRLPPSLPEIDSIQEFLVQMNEINVKANNAITEYEYGIIIAIEFTDKDLHTIEDWGSAGIVSLQPINPEKIVGLCRISKEMSQKEWMESVSNSVVHERMFARDENPDSLVNNLRRRMAEDDN